MIVEARISYVRNISNLLSFQVIKLTQRNIPPDLDYEERIKALGFLILQRRRNITSQETKSQHPHNLHKHGVTKINTPPNFIKNAASPVMT